MANTSILAAFERMWQHVVTALSSKADVSDVDAKMDATNPTGTGSFSLNRKADTTIGTKSHAEGDRNEASAQAAHAEGVLSIASGAASHAEGIGTVASGYAAHAEGMYTTANSQQVSHAEGLNSVASGQVSHAEGHDTYAAGTCQHVQGKYNVKDVDSEGNALNTYAHIVGNGTSDTERSNAHTLDWNGNAWFAGDVYVGGTSMDDATALMKTVNPVGTGSFSMNRKAGTTVGTNSHAEGLDITASGEYSHAEGVGTKATVYAAHAEGNGTTASGQASHAEGNNSVANGNYSHAEGWSTANGLASHAEGWGTIAAGEYQHVEGKRNIEDTENKYAHIVGNGESSSARSNAHTLDWSGNAWFAGDVYVGGTSQDSAGRLLCNSDFVVTGSASSATLTINLD